MPIRPKAQPEKSLFGLCSGLPLKAGKIRLFVGRGSLSPNPVGAVRPVHTVCGVRPAPDHRRHGGKHHVMAGNALVRNNKQPIAAKHGARFRQAGKDARERAAARLKDVEKNALGRRKAAYQGWVQTPAIESHRVAGDNLQLAKGAACDLCVETAPVFKDEIADGKSPRFRTRFQGRPGRRCTLRSSRRPFRFRKGFRKRLPRRGSQAAPSTSIVVPPPS